VLSDIAIPTLSVDTFSRILFEFLMEKFSSYCWAFLIPDQNVEADRIGSSTAMAKTEVGRAKNFFAIGMCQSHFFFSFFFFFFVGAYFRPTQVFWQFIFFSLGQCVLHKRLGEQQLNHIEGDEELLQQPFLGYKPILGRLSPKPNMFAYISLERKPKIKDPLTHPYMTDELVMAWYHSIIFERWEE
jgi:hypothetical protein